MSQSNILPKCQLHPTKWHQYLHRDGCLVSAAVAALEPDSPSMTARYQAFQEDRRKDEAQWYYRPLCPGCTLDKAYQKAEQVLLGNDEVIRDPRTLYALAAVLIGFLDHYKDAELFHMPIAQGLDKRRAP